MEYVPAKFFKIFIKITKHIKYILSLLKCFIIKYNGSVRIHENFVKSGSTHTQKCSVMCTMVSTAHVPYCSEFLWTLIYYKQ